jgi:hypothetical protein
MKRQGDLLIIKVNSIPEDAKKKKTLILAEGEAIGHKHELDSGEVYEEGGILYFKVLGGGIARLNHPEHKTIEFEPGEYEVIRQREYEPKGWRYVED